MSLYSVGQIWYIDIPTAKGRIRRSAGTADKKAAQEYHDQVRERIWRQEKLGERVVTWGEAVAKWLGMEERGLPDRYRLSALNVDPLSALPLSPELLEKSSTGRSPATYNRLLSLVAAIHHASGVTFSAPRKTATAGRTRWLTKEEWAKLQKALLKESPLLEQAARFTLATGLRENNVLNLEWPQIDLRRRVAWLYADQMKGKAPLGVPLNDDAMAVLDERKGVDKRWVFGNPDYPLYKASNRAWYTALRSTGLVGFRWHDLRHTFAAWAVMSGVRLEELMHLGGWKTYSMVMRYAHLSPEHLADASAKVKPVSRKR